jgi:hypothetical protein
MLWYVPQLVPEKYSPKGDEMFVVPLGCLLLARCLGDFLVTW